MQDNDIQSLTRRLIEFRDQRSWKQFHSVKELIVSLNLEAGELLELTQWKSADEFEDSLKDETDKSRLKEECADVFAYLLLIAERTGIDIVQATRDKIEQNEIKYPVEKSKGTAKKYTSL